VALRLREFLDELQEKYGPLPRLLATRADCVDSPEEREYWLMVAYKRAQQLADSRNLVWIAASLAAFHLEDLPEATKGAEWLALLERHRQAWPDSRGGRGGPSPVYPLASQGGAAEQPVQRAAPDQMERRR